MFNRYLIACLLIILSVTSVSAQDAAPSRELPAELEEQMIALEAWTADQRQLDLLSPITRAFPTRVETIAYLEDLYSRELPPAEAERFTLFYTALGLLPQDTDLIDIYLTLLGSQVAGFYDTETQTMNTIPLMGDSVGAELSFTEQIIYVHEFVHALQDQHFGLEALLDDEAISDQPDRSLALVALVEGDATAVMQVYSQAVAQTNPMAVFSLLLEGAASGTLTLPEGVPPVLVRELTFPYEAGLTFVLRLYQEGGWDAIDAAFANPPTTSAQIIHPQLYLDGVGALPVDLGDLGLDESWSLAWDSTLGEYYLRELLLAREVRSGTAALAASGWAGDAFRIYGDGSGDAAWALRVTWQAAAAADEFSAALESWLDAQSPLDDVCYQTVVEVFCITMIEGDTLLFGAPDPALAATMRAALGL